VFSCLPPFVATAKPEHVAAVRAALSAMWGGVGVIPLGTATPEMLATWEERLP
jgi:hypothetical protein